MSKCDYDGIFYRLFCVTLLAVAFTFTVILTNVFIDIDGILTKKDHDIEKPKGEILAVAEKTKEAVTQSVTDNEVVFHGEQLEMRTEVVFQNSVDSKIFAKKEDILLEREEEEDNSRTKRSLDTPKFQLHSSHPKIKEILNNKLASLLEELDAEESHDTKLKNVEEVPKPTEHHSEKIIVQEKPKTVKQDTGMLHLAMHNILLQGIIGHMEISDVYKKVHELMNKFESKGKHSDGTTKIGNVDSSLFGELFKDKSQKPYPNDATDIQNPDFLESTFLEELIKCEELQKQLEAASEVKLDALKRSNLKLDAVRRSGSQSIDKKVPKILIRTVIDIKTVKNQSDSKAHISNDNIKGLIKLIYNGKPIEFSAMKEDNIVEESTTSAPELSVIQVDKLPEYVDEDSGIIVDNFINKALSQYLKNYPTLERKLKTKRLKRQVKSKKGKPNKEKDDEVFIEIETHFDSKGLKGKKKKLVQQLVEKIRAAVNSQMNSLAKMKKVKKEAVMQIKKRIQSPLKPKDSNVLLNKIIIPLDKIVLRESEPISKVVKIPQPMPLISNSVGENIGAIYHKSGFLSEAKSINSGELGAVNLEFDKVIDETGVPQRLQKPLNTDNIEEQSETDNVVSLGNLKFYVKNIDGAGFSIGFNQYVGEAPDPDSIKVFTGLQQLINDVGNKYDANKNGEPGKMFGYDPKAGLENNYSYENVEANHELRKRDAKELNDLKHDGNDYRYNEYRVIFDNSYQPYDSYSQTIEDVNKKVSVSIVKDPAPNGKKSGTKTEPLLPLIIDGDLFTKPLNPSEIFSLANLLDRKKRNTVLKKYSDLKTRTKLNRYLNTVKMAKFNKKRRFKRQIDKIRIIASDGLPRSTRRSEDENVFIVSDDDNIFADRAIIREQEREREAEDIEQDNDQEEHHELVYPNNVYEDNFNPYHMFATRARQNTLMSKYPHVFVDEMSQSKEDSNAFYNRLINGYADAKTGKLQDSLHVPFVVPTPTNDPMFVQSEQTGANDDTVPKSNYKLIVKIVPKNSSDDPGFKEVHTSINKSRHRNGLLYSSQVNVTELSKVENLIPPALLKNNMLPAHYSFNNIDVGAIDDNQTNILPPMPQISNSYVPLVNHIKEQQEKMKLLLKKHKQRIDDQLNTLKQEKQNLDSMIVPFDKKEMIDVMLPLSPPQVLHLNKDEAGQLISKALMKLHTVPQLNDVLNFTKNHTENVHEVITKQPNVIQSTSSTVESDKIIKTIQRNENLTSTILHKIDKNTDMLQTFLQRLSERMAPMAPAHTYPLPDQRPLSRGPIQDSLYNQRHIHDPFFGQTMPNLEVHKNATHVSIPFVYAYQQPYPLNSKPNSPVASVVYQGHIHTNAYNNFNKNINVNPNPVIPEKEALNRTHFFMDEPTDTLFKIVPAGQVEKSYDISRVKSNVSQGFVP